MKENKSFLQHLFGFILLHLKQMEKWVWHMVILCDITNA